MKKTITILLTLLLAFGAFVGCKKRFDANDPQKLEIFLYNAGYGYEWCRELLDAFEAEPWVKEKYPDLKTNVDKDENAAKALELMTATKKVNRYEIVMGTGLESSLGPDANVLDLTKPVYESEVPGEPGVLFKDKLIGSYLTSAAYNGKGGAGEKKYYQVNWASGMTGLIYNEDKLKALGFDVPNTTDELTKIMRDVKALDGANPAYSETTSIATYGSSSYASYLYYIWWAQYQTADEYINFYNGVDSETQSRSPAVFRQTGMLEALNVLEAMMHRDNGLVWLNPNTGREAYRETQNRVLLGNALFMANGDWSDNELATLRQGLIEQNGRVDTVKLMRTPVISAIRSRTPSIKSDEQLSAVVEAIDAGEDSHEGVTPEDFAVVKAAREVVYSIGPGHNAYIPAFASGQGPAIDFLRFLATDKANEIYIRSTKGASLPFDYDAAAENPDLLKEISPMQRARLEYFNAFDVNVLPSQGSFPMVRFGGLSNMASGNPIVDFTSGTSKGNYKSVAEMAFEREYKYWTENSNANWNNCLTQSGLS